MSYLLPVSTTTIPGGLTLERFIQTVLVGISGLSPSLVRPNWQPNPPKEPDIAVNWLAFGIILGAPNANAFVGMDEIGNMNSQRHQELKIKCSFYGPEAMTYANIVTDGFQIPPNLEALASANMGYVSTGPMIPFPELVNERWFYRVEMEVNLRREIERVYGVLSMIGALGTIHADGTPEEYNQDWQTPGDI